MTDDPPPIKRKIRAVDAAEGRRTAHSIWARAARVGLGRSLDVNMSIDVVEQTSVNREDLAPLWTEGDLVLLLEGPNGFGAAILSAELLAGLLEIQAFNRITERPILERLATRIDAALVADLLDQMFEAQEGLAKALPPPQPSNGFRFAEWLPHGRDLAIRLEGQRLERMTIQIELSAGGARAGHIDLALPPKQKTAAKRSQEADATWGARFIARLNGGRVALRADLKPMTLTLPQLKDLEVGMQLPIDRTAFDQVLLRGEGDLYLATGRLGRFNDMKAIRLSGDPGETAEPGTFDDGITTGHDDDAGAEAEAEPATVTELKEEKVTQS